MNRTIQLPIAPALALFSARRFSARGFSARRFSAPGFRPQARPPVQLLVPAAFFAALLMHAPQIVAQAPPATRLEFEVATVKRVAPVGKVQLPNGSYLVQGPRISWKGGRLTLQNYPLKSIIESAWDVKDYQVVGPAWLDSDTFQIVAKAPPNTTEEQARLMCQLLLADRFRLALHREPREFPVYALVPGKGGPRLSKNGPGAPNGKNGEEATDKITTAKLSDGHVDSPRASMSWLAETLTKRLGKPVIDETGIKGEFHISLDWTPDPGDPPLYPGAKMPPPGFTGENSSGPSIFTAIQEQLGLRLEARKGMVDVLVIDNVERVPTDN